MKFILELFKKKEKIHKDLTPYLGGDGLKPENPIIINCSSDAMASHLLERYISDKHGVKETDWLYGMSFTLKSKSTECGMVKAVIVNVNKEEYTYYFDFSRSMKNPF